MSLADNQSAMIEVLKQRLAGVVQEVRPHRGQFESLKEIQKIATRSPCVLVSYRGFKNVAELVKPQADVQWVVYVVAQERAGLDRTTIVSKVAESITNILMRQRWGLDCSHPMAISARNITTGDIDNAGLSLWAIAFDQNMEIENQGDNTAYIQLLEIFAQHEQAEGAPVASDLIHLEQEPQP